MMHTITVVINNIINNKLNVCGIRLSGECEDDAQCILPAFTKTSHLQGLPDGMEQPCVLCLTKLRGR